MEEREKYKEGKSIVEKAKVMKVSSASWQFGGHVAGQLLPAAPGVHKGPPRMWRC